ncbi:MAG: phosphatase PAP2 family protein [Niabella sp.]
MDESIMEANIINNYARLKFRLFILPLFLLALIVIFLLSLDALNVDRYIQVQKDIFFFINHHLGQYPNLQLNLTQFGDGLILLSFLSIFLLCAPKIWEVLIPSLLVSVLFSHLLKKIFGVPRPVELLDSSCFIIIGRRVSGFSSLPSGHSITIFTVLTVLLFAFMPLKLKYKIAWCFFVIVTGLILAFTRVGVGAHYPIDVIVGCIIGYISGLSGIFISRRYKIGHWINSKKCYPFFIILFLIGCGILANKIIKENLMIFYLSFISLIISLYKIITVYAKNIKR